MDSFLESQDACIQIEFLIGTMDDTLFKVSVLLYSNNFLDLADIVIFESNALASDTKSLLSFALIENDRLLLKLFKKSGAENTLLKITSPWIESGIPPFIPIY